MHNVGFFCLTASPSLSRFPSNMGCHLARTTRDDYVDVTKVKLFSPNFSHKKQQQQRRHRGRGGGGGGGRDARDDGNHPGNDGGNGAAGNGGATVGGRKGIKKHVTREGKRMSRREVLADELKSDLRKRGRGKEEEEN